MTEISNSILGKIQSAGAAFEKRAQEASEKQTHRDLAIAEEARKAEEYETRARAMGMQVVNLLRVNTVQPLPLIEKRVKGDQQNNTHIHAGEAWYLYTDVVEPNISDELNETFYLPVAITHLGRLCTGFTMPAPSPKMAADLAGSGLKSKKCLIDPDYSHFAMGNAPWSDAITTLESEHFQTRVAELLYRQQKSK